MNNKDRKPGWYWVKLNSGKWSVLYWNGFQFSVPLVSALREENTFLEINEVAIIQPNK